MSYVRYPKYRAKNPAKCWKHGGQVQAYERSRAQRVLEQKREEKKKEDIYRFKIINDLENNLKPKTLPTGETIVSVYRSGVPSPPKERGVEKNSYLSGDLQKPAGRCGRTEGVFASPTLGAVGRWVRGNAFSRIKDLRVRELRVDYDKTFVYPVRLWEKYSSNEFMFGAEHPTTVDSIKKYWSAGIPLREYVEKVKQNPDQYDPINWELLIKEEEIKTVKPVSASRVSGYYYSEGYEKEFANLLKAPVSV